MDEVIKKNNTKIKRIIVIGILVLVLVGAGALILDSRYPKTGQEMIRFDDNIGISVIQTDKNRPNDFTIKIHNNNDELIYGCEVSLYVGKSYKESDIPFFYKNNIIVKGNQTTQFNVTGVDYHNTFIKLKYRVGLALNRHFNTMWRAGDLRALDSSYAVQGWEPVTQDEINTFLNENDVNPISSTQIYGFYTIIMFQNGNTEGYYELYKDTRSNEVRSRLVKGYISDDRYFPVKRAGGTATGNYPFTNFIINDPDLIQKGDKIELLTNSGTIKTRMFGKKGHTVETKGFGNIKKIMIYDKQDTLIYSEEF